MTHTPVTQDITRITLAVLGIGALLGTSLWIMSPFLSSIMWAAMIVIAMWPFMLRLQSWLRGSRRLAVLVITLVLLLVLIAPLSLAVGTIVGNVDLIASWANNVHTLTVPPPPEWVAGVPVVGGKLAETWQRLASGGVDSLTAEVKPYMPKVASWFAARAGSAGVLLIHFLLTVIIATILFIHGETAAEGVLRFARRLAGKHGESAAILAANAVRGVALGVVVTALFQSVLGGIGLAITGVPAPGLWTAIMFLLCLAQLGPALVLVPAVVWLFWSGHTLAGSVLLVVSIFATTVDNVLRPILIRKGVELPLILIFAGVLGGLASIGIVGIFVGPTVLAVTFTLLKTWVNTGGERSAAPEVPGVAEGAKP
jgi:predicted PurR-regulated permease PerM